MSAGVSNAGTIYDAASGPPPITPIVRSPPQEDGTPATDVNWAATIDLVQNVAQRFRTLQSSTQTVARDADHALKRAMAEAAAAQARARDMRAEADAAIRRADAAEAQIEILTHELAAAGERIDTAERRVAELSAWLRDIHDCLTDEFNTLTIAPPSIQK